MEPDEHAPRVIGLSKSLGEGASVHFEHADLGQKDTLPWC